MKRVASRDPPFNNNFDLLSCLQASTALGLELQLPAKVSEFKSIAELLSRSTDSILT
jgi:hypothetical protein